MPLGRFRALSYEEMEEDDHTPSEIGSNSEPIDKITYVKEKTMQSPTTDKDIGIAHSSWGIGDDKFRSVRQKAEAERQELKHRSKKDKTVKVPDYAPGDRVVVTVGFSDRTYRLIEVVDFSGEGRRRFTDYFHEYYGILIKTTDKDDLGRIGRLCTFSGRAHSAHVGEDDIRWLDAE